MAKTTNETIEALAADIGKDVYMDIAKWHLYLSDAHLHTVLAEKLFPLLSSQSVDENQVLKILQSIPVKLASGKKEIPLSDFLPMQSQVNLMDILEKYQREAW